MHKKHEHKQSNDDNDHKHQEDPPKDETTQQHDIHDHALKGCD